MCYFDQFRWACGFCTWGNFREQCSKESRIGHTCGLKLVFSTEQQDEACRACQGMAKKQRRIVKMTDDVQRWRQEGNRNATIEKTNRDILTVQAEIQDLWQRHL